MPLRVVAPNTRNGAPARSASICAFSSAGVERLHRTVRYPGLESRYPGVHGRALGPSVDRRRADETVPACVPHTFSAVRLSRALSSPAGRKPTAKPTSSSPPRRSPSSSSRHRRSAGDRTSPCDELDRARRSDARRQRRATAPSNLVLRQPDDGVDFYKIEDALPLKADSRGVYWHEDGASWDGDEALRQRRARLGRRRARARRPLRAPRHGARRARQARRSRSRAKLERAASAAGTCRGATARPSTTVERDQRLTLPNLEVQADAGPDRPGRDPAARLRARPPRQGPLRARRDRIKNIGNEPLRGLYDARLQVGDKLYEQSSEAT